MPGFGSNEEAGRKGPAWMLREGLMGEWELGGSGEAYCLCICVPVLPLAGLLGIGD